MFIQKAEFWLFNISVGLIALYTHSLWRLNGNFDRISLGLVFWGALLSLLWKKRYSISLKSDPLSSFIGLFLITLVLLRIPVLYKTDEVLLSILFLVSALSVGLLAVGARELKNYWWELLIVFLLALPTSTIGLLLDTYSYFTIATAKFSTVLLWYLGFEVSRQGVYVVLPSGGVEVNSFVQQQCPC